MRDVFGFEKDIYPQLDDLLTCIDISTNSEHHLGINYSPVHLKALKRLIFTGFLQFWKTALHIQEVEKLIRFFIENRLEYTGFLVLNWDTVLEKYISAIAPKAIIDYCNGGRYLTEDLVLKKKGMEKEKLKF